MTTVLWTPETRARVLPRRSHGERAPLPTGGEARAQVDAVYILRRAAIVAGSARALDVMGAQQEKAVAYLDHEAAPHAVNAAAAAILVQSNLPDDLGITNDALSRAFVDSWLEEGGAAYAVLACASTTAFTVNPASKSIVLAPLPREVDAMPQRLERRWRALRRRLATMPDPDYEAARAAAETLLAKASPRLALRLVHAFPDETTWSEALARTLIDLNQTMTYEVLLSSVSDVALANELVALHENAAFVVARSVFDLADALGENAESALLAIAESAVHQLWGFAQERQDAFTALALIPSAAVASWFAEHLHDKDARGVGIPYLKSLPDLARVALRPLAQAKKPNERASALLGTIERAGNSPAGDEELPAPVTAPRKPKKLPAWLDLASLPRPTLKATGRALSLSATHTVLQLLVQGDPAPARAACDASEFAWAIFESWCAADYPSKDKWAFFAIGHFGADAHAHRLAQLIRGWPTEGAFARAVMGLDVLATMRSDTSLMLLHGISEKVKSRPLLYKAREKIDAVARSLALGTDDLADRLVPTLGLDDDGSRLLDFGPRQFRVGFDEFLRPFVRDTNGKKLSDLPKVGANDDPDRAQAATNTWKAIKRDAKATAAAQLVRLENAMVAQRRWEPTPFAMYVVGHPLVGHLARRLAFGAYNRKNDLLATFRVAEDGTYADEQDAAFVVPEDARIGVLHPLEVQTSVLAAIGERFSDYEILQPFPQVGRETPRGITLADATKFESVDTLKLLALERRGWRRGPVGDGGVVSTFEKEVGTLHALVHLEPGIQAGDPTAHDRQTLTGLDIRGGDASGPPPIFLAEVTADLRGVGALTSPP